MRIILASNYEDLSRHAANMISAQILLKPKCVLGLATGSSPVGAYQELGRRCVDGYVDFQFVQTVNLDEYVGLPADHEQSYARFMRENLFNHVNIKQENTHIPSGVSDNPKEECLRYDKLITRLGIDLQLLGIGPNGHIGFNEPADEFIPETHKVTLTQETIQANKRFFASEDDVPRYALTMGIRAIMQAKRVLMVANGEAKADAIRDTLLGPITPRVPASILRLHPDFTLVVDRAALSKCDRTALAISLQV